MFGGVAFKGAAFSGTASFADAAFSDTAWFDDAAFSDTAWFDDAAFSGTARFRGATFDGTAQFADVKFSEKARVFSAAFRYARFEKSLDFSHKDFRAFAAFDGATIVGDVTLSDEAVFRSRHLKAVRDGIISDKDYARASLKSLENGARVLKLAFERQRDRLKEQQMYRLELLARQKQDVTPWFTKLVTSAYGLTADFGGSIGRPLLSILLGWLAFALLFASIAASWQVPAGDVGAWAEAARRWPLFADASLFSARNVFRPFYIWGLERGDGTAFDQSLLYGAPGGALATFATLGLKLLATLQSFFSIAMLFLTGLAARRYFQLS